MPYLQFTYEEGVNIGYRWFDQNDIDPLYEFGYGLSYTSFDYHNGQVNVINGDSQDPNVKVSASIDIENTGTLDGAEVPQLYLSFPEIANEPPRVLRGFEKVFINRGTAKHVKFVLEKTELTYYDVDVHSWVVPKGVFELHIGSSSRKIKFSQTFTLNQK